MSSFYHSERFQMVACFATGPVWKFVQHKKLGFILGFASYRGFLDGIMLCGLSSFHIWFTKKGYGLYHTERSQVLACCATCPVSKFGINKKLGFISFRGFLDGSSGPEKEWNPRFLSVLCIIRLHCYKAMPNFIHACQLGY